ncbi:DUF72 domain-containing protein [Streptomyces sp. Go40/10]|uniref:DUF72 domain-containing protein n=1 Tax=Streptomyces sp. Go40/10 TaxID=2825844 RepID=UPI001E38CBAA|nr:DUF72 domain-containing protein [Streptomyces sp. Go40/10]UFR04862.1 DUF72 domain-containing protein [Streptomyces sp. Go40/10]
MAEILIGTCGWTDPELLRSGWYPPGHRDAEKRLRHYATRFPVVEADSPYYALPTPRTTTLWADRTPPGFRFDVKAFSLLTGHRTRPAALPADLRGHPRDEALRTEVWTRYAEALTPLLRSGRLGTLLFQFPPSLAPGPDAEAFVRTARERARGWPFAVEFRDPAWWHPARAPRTTAFLEDLDATAVAVDTVQGLPTSMPADTPATSARLAVVRFHGRSPHWGTGTKEDRFRHAYTERELLAWLPRVQALAEATDELHILFNNCCGDAAPTAARTLQDLLRTRLPHQRTPTTARRPPAHEAPRPPSG